MCQKDAEVGDGGLSLGNVSEEEDHNSLCFLCPVAIQDLEMLKRNIFRKQGGGVLNLDCYGNRKSYMCTAFNICIFLSPGPPTLNGICRVRLLTSMKCNPWLCH